MIETRVLGIVGSVHSDDFKTELDFLSSTVLSLFAMMRITKTALRTLKTTILPTIVQNPNLILRYRKVTLNLYLNSPLRKTGLNQWD